MNALLTARSACQDGVFTVRDAAACGVDARTLRRLVAAGTVVRVAPSAYADGLRYAAGSAEQRHALTARAVVLTFQGRAVASHASALTVLGIPVLDADVGRVHLARTADDLSRRGRYIVLHGSYGPGTWCPGEPCVAPALAVLGNAMVSGTESGAAAMDRALATGLVTAADLQAGLERLASWPGVGKARLAVALADGRAESVGETRARLLLGAIGFADLVPQARIADADGHVVARVDFLLGGRVVVEFDGAVKYDGVEGRGGAGRGEAAGGPAALDGLRGGAAGMGGPERSPAGAAARALGAGESPDGGVRAGVGRFLTQIRRLRTRVEIT